MVSAEAGPTERLPLSRELLLKTAVAFADSHGIGALSMRKLAGELGYEAMSLYNHVANKDDLLAAMIDAVAAEIELPDDGPDWKAALRRNAVSAHQAFSRHGWAPAIWYEHTPGQARALYMESILRCQRLAGLSAELTYHGYHALTMHVVGFAMQELNFVDGDRDLSQLAEEFLASPAAPGLPYLAEHVVQHVNDHEDDEFEFILDMILDGLEDLHRKEQTAR